MLPIAETGCDKFFPGKKRDKARFLKHAGECRFLSASLRQAVNTENSRSSPSEVLGRLVQQNGTPKTTNTHANNIISVIDKPAETDAEEETHQATSASTSHVSSVSASSTWRLMDGETWLWNQRNQVLKAHCAGICACTKT